MIFLFLGLNGFYPFVLFDAELTPGMPQDLITPAFHSMYGVDGSLSVWGPDYEAPTAPFVFVAPPDQIMAEKTYNFLTKNFFDSFLKCEKKALKKLVKGNRNYLLEQHSRNICQN